MMNSSSKPYSLLNNTYNTESKQEKYTQLAFYYSTHFLDYSVYGITKYVHKLSDQGNLYIYPNNAWFPCS